MMPAVVVDYRGGERFTVGVRGHGLTVVESGTGQDEPDAAPTATELFVASLASCVAVEARRLLARYGQPTAGLRVSADYTISTDWPPRVTSIDLALSLPTHLPVGWANTLHAIASNCMVYNSMRTPPQITARIACRSPGDTPDS